MPERSRVSFCEAKGAGLSSRANDWVTPQPLFDEWDRLFHFTLDVAASHQNYRVKKYFTIEEDALRQAWNNDVCWMNPPYGRGLKKWIQKAHRESLRGAIIVGLIPARTDTSYWHKWIFPCADICFLRGRVKFLREGDIIDNAPFPSAMVVWGDELHRAKQSLGDLRQSGWLPYGVEGTSDLGH